MIRGTTAQFKFHMPYDFEEMSVIKATFWQPGNEGTIEAPLPIIRVYNRQFITVDAWPEEPDITKVYFYDKFYHKFEKDGWITSDNMNDFIRNDGFAYDDNDHKIVFTTLTSEETLRFCDTCKGYVQIKGYSDTQGLTFGSKPTRFMVYPVADEDIFENIGQGIDPNTGVQILDAGELK